MINFLKTTIYEPLYNILILILNVPYLDAGLAAAILTILVKVILFPIARKASITQFKMKDAGDELKIIKEKYKDRETQALKTMEFYKKSGINPLSGILGIIIQIPIVYSLYHIFLHSGLPVVNQEMLYSFVPVPQISMNFLGILDISEKSILLAFLAAVTSFLQMHFASVSSKHSSSKADDKPDLSQIMGKQMKYTFPIIVFFISWQISGVIALYWFVSNLAGMAQDYIIKRKLVLQSQHPQKPI